MANLLSYVNLRSKNRREMISSSKPPKQQDGFLQCMPNSYRAISYKRHIRQHRKEMENLNKCSVCHRTFSDKYSLKHHVNQQYDVSKRMVKKCDYREKTFTSRQGIKYHLKKTHNIATGGNSNHKCREYDLDRFTRTRLEDYKRSVHGAVN